MIGKWYRSYLNGPWRLTTINVNPEDFDDFTVNAFIERDFGNINAYMVPKDKERMIYQTKIATGNGDNEPVILVMDKSSKKYQIVEGWHRTMAILKIGDNGEDLKNWDNVKLRAYITTM
jgi:transcription elongation factor GreA-like protein